MTILKDNQIEVKAYVRCPTHQAIINLISALGWEFVGRETTSEGAVYSRWMLKTELAIVDILESTDFASYQSRQKQAIQIIATTSRWCDNEYALVSAIELNEVNPL